LKNVFNSKKADITHDHSDEIRVGQHRLCMSKPFCV